VIKLPGQRPHLNSARTYEAITVNGVVDIIEHRKMEPYFYLTDEPEVWNRLAPKR